MIKSSAVSYKLAKVKKRTCKNQCRKFREKTMHLGNARLWKFTVVCSVSTFDADSNARTMITNTQLLARIHVL